MIGLQCRLVIPLGERASAYFEAESPDDVARLAEWLATMPADPAEIPHWVRRFGAGDG